MYYIENLSIPTLRESQTAILSPRDDSQAPIPIRGRTNQAEVPIDNNKIATSRRETSRRTRTKKNDDLKRIRRRASIDKRG